MPPRRKSAGTSPSHRRRAHRPSTTQRASSPIIPHSPPPRTRSPSRSTRRANRSRHAAAEQAGDLVIPGNPYAIISAIAPDQTPRYRNTGFLRRGEWTQSGAASKDRRHKRSDFPSTDNGPRDGGRFGTLDPSDRYAYTRMYSAEATTDPGYRPDRWGFDGERGYGELVPGIDGGEGYGSREVPSQWAQAEWTDAPEPHIPGRGGSIVARGSQKRAFSRFDDVGYRDDAIPRNDPQPREYTARERANMRQQFWEEGDEGAGRAWQWHYSMMSPEERDRDLMRAIAEEYRDAYRR